MQTWKTQMPAGMRLKSDGFASNLCDANNALTLGNYCRDSGNQYADEGIPVPLETFIAYGETFQKRMVPQLEKRQVTDLTNCRDGFELALDNDEIVRARQVIVAAGICRYAYMPPALRNMPQELVSHSSAHVDVSAYAGKEVVLLGGGSSAVDLAVLLQQQGARPRLVTRHDSVCFHSRTPLQQRSAWQRLTQPHTGIGPGWRALFYTETPNLFRLIPKARRLKVVKNTCGPSGGWFMKELFEARVPVLAGCSIDRAEVAGGRVRLGVTDSHGVRSSLTTDHLIACTGYKVDLRRLEFIDRSLLKRVRMIEQSPVLRANFESSVKGLHFVGTASANSYGPMMRFVVGATYTARSLSRYLAANTTRRASAISDTAYDVISGSARTGDAR